MKTVFRILLLLGVFSCIWRSTKIYAKTLSLSVVIPCTSSHAQYLSNLLWHYAHQTERPDEIIVSFSEFDTIDKSIIEALSRDVWPFKLILLCNSCRTSAGKNRNLGIGVATSDIIMFQDADDLPHPQRVEIVKYFFSMYDIYYLLHLYIRPQNIENYCRVPKEFIWYRKGRVACEKKPFEALFCHEDVHCGQPSILRKVASKVSWPEQWITGEDVEYNKRIFEVFSGKTMFIRAKLVLYRQKLGSKWEA